MVTLYVEYPQKLQWIVYCDSLGVVIKQVVAKYFHAVS